MDVASPGFLGLLALLVVLFAGSTFFSARTLRREIRDALARKQPVPDLVRWWRAVARRRVVLAAGGAAGIAAGVAASLLGLGAPGRALIVLGLCALAYVAQAHVLVAVARRAGA